MRTGRPSEEDVSDKPAPIIALPEATEEERVAIRDVARQRAESIFAWDRGFCRVVRELERTGEYDDAVFVWTSDNGYHNDEHRMREGKIWPTRCPCGCPWSSPARASGAGSAMPPRAPPI